MINIVGTIATLLAVMLDVPQVKKAWGTKSMRDFSISFLFIRMAMLGCWLIYAIQLNNPILIIANILSTLTNLVLIIFYFKFEKVYILKVK